MTTSSYFSHGVNEGSESHGSSDNHPRSLPTNVTIIRVTSHPGRPAPSPARPTPVPTPIPQVPVPLRVPAPVPLPVPPVPVLPVSAPVPSVPTHRHSNRTDEWRRRPAVTHPSPFLVASHSSSPHPTTPGRPSRIHVMFISLFTGRFSPLSIRTRLSFNATSLPAWRRSSFSPAQARSKTIKSSDSYNDGDFGAAVAGTR